MKSSTLSLILNIVLLIAVAVLFAREFTGEAEETKPEVEKTAEQEDQPEEVLKDTLDIASIYQKDLVIAYVNSDSIDANYKYLKEKEDELIQRTRQSDARVKREMNKAQNRYNELMQKAQSGGFTSEQEYIDAEAEVAELQQQIERLRTEEANSLSQVQRELQMQFSEKVNDFLDRYSDDRDIDIILSYMPGGQLLWASDSLEITEEVLEGLNREYEAETAPKNPTKE
ncbi:OmpH/Skp family outer membrane protein [Halocola ammonii]